MTHWTTRIGDRARGIGYDPYPTAPYRMAPTPDPQGPTGPPPPPWFSDPHYWTPPQPPPKEKGRGWRKTFYAWNVFALLYFVVDVALYASKTHSDCVNTGVLNHLCESAHHDALGGAIILMLIIWAVVSAILYMIWRAARS